MTLRMAASGSKKPGWMSVMLLKERSRDLQKGSVGDRDKIYKIKNIQYSTSPFHISLVPKFRKL